MIRKHSTPWIYRHSRPLMGAIASVGASTTAYLTVSKLLHQSVACPIKGCEQVLNSAYATVLGVPLSFWGFLAYSTMVVLALAPLLANSFPNQQRRNDLEQWTALFMFIGAAAMATFSGYLMYLLAFQIHALCLYCIVSALLSLSLLILAVTGQNCSEPGQLVLTGIVVAIVTIVGTLWLYMPLNNCSPQLDRSVSVSLLSDLKQASRKGLASNITTAKTLLQVIPGALPTGKLPEVLNIGADYCPYCATLRWSLALTLLRFGELDGLHYMRSSSTDVYPNTPTFSFYKSNYQSPYLTFTSVELQDREGKPLQRPTTKQQSLLEKFDNTPYTDNPGSIPFVYVDGRYLQSGASVSPELLHGLSWSLVAQQLQPTFRRSVS